MLMAGVAGLMVVNIAQLRIDGKGFANNWVASTNSTLQEHKNAIRKRKS